ncbi:DNA-binding transcriptional LysR family regulator [Acidovorax delafieldii]|uniref:DNA-binding transcriptional LysR family regulator n=1 Tax=Acidovorax delafieldii TaxID=47920 RepID=A0AAJ2BV09_ACIDE|nr:LysR family transcriptional regulator [Acidovorax delafieldii]MDR6769027.1 DNA-binding transcriptional LysR family regulator [Acidovorax delafieldii]MDR6839404.1 DNA-binding transcriptional LysR family regulator [Acidovorax delafieldii]MDR7368955.1 DNA-binding transcriptional LysR family regulator [Acidovorax delafieldii]
MRDIRFEDMHLFARVADLGSLSTVARERDAPVSQVSRALARIEQSCGARLVHRSTHGLTLTAEGQTFLDYCRRITGALDELEGEFAQQSGQPSGWVRVASSSVVAEYLLIPSFESLQQQHPQLRVELVVDDRMADMARDGIDIAIRTGPPLTDTVVARPLGTLARALYATPGYLQARGVPQQPGDLRQHRLITNSAVTFLNHWPFLVDGVPEVLVAEGHWRSGSTAITARLALQGLGIARLATVVADPLVRQGLLAPVLAHCVDLQPTPIHAITLTRRHRLPKIQACIDHWATWFSVQASGAGYP